MAKEILVCQCKATHLAMHFARLDCFCIRLSMESFEGSKDSGILVVIPYGWSFEGISSRDGNARWYLLQVDTHVCRSPNI
jgi:hypothetical protein